MADTDTDQDLEARTSISPSTPTTRNAPRERGARAATVDGWLHRLTDPHRPCRQAVAELSALVTADRDRQQGAAEVAAAAIAWLEQRAAGYAEDARHVRAARSSVADADRFAKAVAAELRQAAVDVAHALGQRGE